VIDGAVRETFDLFRIIGNMQPRLSVLVYISDRCYPGAIPVLSLPIEYMQLSNGVRPYVRHAAVRVNGLSVIQLLVSETQFSFNFVLLIAHNCLQAQPV